MVYSDIYLRSLISGAGFTTGCFVAVFVLLGIVVGLFGTNLLRINFKTTAVEEKSEDEDQLESKDQDDQDDDYQDSQDDDSQDSQDDDSQDDQDDDSQDDQDDDSQDDQDDDSQDEDESEREE